MILQNRHGGKVIVRIIVEGCDGVGKTTLAKKLAEKYNIKSYMHITRDDPNTAEFYVNTLNKTDVIFDRHFIGEMIYPKIFGRHGNLTDAGFNFILNRARQLGYRIFILYSDKETIKQRLKEDEHNEVIENIEVINDRFIKLAMNYGIQLINTSEDSFEFICEAVEGFVGK